MSDLSPAQIKDRVSALFSSSEFGAIFDKLLGRINSAKMRPLLSHGVVVGFSAGPDSVALLCTLLRFKFLFMPNLNIIALHVNHLIRGDEAYRDESLAIDICEALGVELVVERRDVPSIAQAKKIGLEECAREVRYEAFEALRESRNFSAIAVAHNADDNAETVLLNIIRGAGLNGVAGIRSIRGNIIRPLLGVSKADILNVLDSFSIPYAVDSSNADSDYSRNYLRNKVIPLFKSINPSYLESFSNLSRILREDNDYLEKCADLEYEKIKDWLYEGVECGALLALETPIRTRVICRILQGLGDDMISFDTVERIEALLTHEGRISVGGDFDIASCKDKLYIIDNSLVLDDIYCELSLGENKIEKLNVNIIIGDIDDKSYSNVYNFSIHAYLSSAIIKDGLFVRCRRDGDTIKFGGMTRKLKKLYNDRDIPSFLRDFIPIISDSKGIAWVPGLPVREEIGLNSSERVKITMLYNRKFNVARKN